MGDLSLGSPCPVQNQSEVLLLSLSVWHCFPMEVVSLLRLRSEQETTIQIQICFLWGDYSCNKIATTEASIRRNVLSKMSCASAISILQVAG